MKRTVIASAFAICLGVSAAWAGEAGIDSEAECRSISDIELSGCRCQSLYFESKFGPEEGAAALHLVGRSYVPEPRVTTASLYERFGAAKLNLVAQKILETQGEVAFFCPFSTNLAE
jgi:hypothetical protein